MDGLTPPNKPPCISGCAEAHPTTVCTLCPDVLRHIAVLAGAGVSMRVDRYTTRVLRFDGEDVVRRTVHRDSPELKEYLRSNGAWICVSAEMRTRIGVDLAPRFAQCELHYRWSAASSTCTRRRSAIASTGWWRSMRACAMRTAVVFASCCMGSTATRPRGAMRTLGLCRG